MPVHFLQLQISLISKSVGLFKIRKGGPRRLQGDKTSPEISLVFSCLEAVFAQNSWVGG